MWHCPTPKTPQLEIVGGSLGGDPRRKVGSDGGVLGNPKAGILGDKDGSLQPTPDVLPKQTTIYSVKQGPIDSG